MFACEAPSSAGPKAKAGAKRTTGKTTTTQSTGGNPLVAASKVRSRTTKDFCEVERLLNKAMADAENIFDVVAPKLMAPEAIKQDPTLELLRQRQLMVTIARDTSSGKVGLDMSKDLYDRACQDPYLKDCRTTFLADPEACQTMGVVRYTRNVLLDLYLGHTCVRERCIGVGPERWGRVNSIVLYIDNE